MKTTGNILKQYIKGKIKRDDFSKLLGISPQYLSNILSDKKKPSSKLLYKLIISLGITSEDEKNIRKYEELRTKKVYYNIINKKMTKEGLKGNEKERIYSNRGKIFGALTDLSLFITLEYDLFDFKKGDVLVFKKYEDEEIKEAYIIYENKIAKLRKVDKSYILETDELKILQNISIEYILLYSIRRKLWVESILVLMVSEEKQTRI